jgi:hypothetical protein
MRGLLTTALTASSSLRHSLEGAKSHDGNRVDPDAFQE